MILDAIAARPDAIVLCPCSTDQTVPYAEQIEQAGIRLVLADSTMDQPMGSAGSGYWITTQPGISLEVI